MHAHTHHGQGSEDGLIDIVDVSCGYKHVRSLQGHGLHVTHIDWYAESDGRSWLLQTSATTRELKHWRVTLKSDTRTQRGGFADLEGESLLAEAVRDVTWETWTLPVGWHVQGIMQDLPTDETLAMLSPGHIAADKAVRALWREGDLVIVGARARMRLFRWPCFTLTARYKEYPAHVSDISAIAMRAQSGHVVSCASSDGAVLHWRLTLLSDKAARQQASAANTPAESDAQQQEDHSANQEKEAAARNLSGFACFSPDASRICAITSDTEAAVFSVDWRTAQSSRDLVYALHKYAVNGCCFGPGGETVCTVSQDTEAHVWLTQGPDAGKDSRRLVLRGHERDVVGSAYTLPGDMVATASLDRTARCVS
jgi:WD40 repeat protein